MPAPTEVNRTGRTPGLLRSVSFWFLIAVMGATGLMLSLEAQRIWKRFLGSQQAIAEHTTNGAAALITGYFNELGFRVYLFSAVEREALMRLADDPEDIDALNHLQVRIAEYFKHAFAFTLADARGEVLVEDFDGRIEEVCKNDMKRFAADPEKRVTYIHPNPAGYHFDMTRKIALSGGRTGLLFLSLRATRIAELLATSQAPGHRLMLLNRARPGLIEVGAQGSREVFGEHIHLAADDLRAVLSRRDIPGSQWQLVDVPDGAMIATELRRIVTRTALTFLAFVALGVGLYVLVWRREHKVAQTQLALVEANASLEARVAERTQEIENAYAALARQVELTEEALGNTMRANQALAASQGRIRQILDGALAAMLMVDDTGCIVFANPQACRLFGYSVGGLEGTQIDQLLPPKLREEHARLRQVFLESPFAGVMSNREVLGMSKDGQELHLAVGLNRVETPEGHMTLATALDISDRARFEAMLRQRNEALEKSNRELQEFAYVASHDLQEPLRKITAFGDRLRSRQAERLDDQGRDYLARMMGAAERMSLLIQDLLAYSRVATRAEPFRATDLNHVMHGVLDDLEVRMRETGARIEVGELPVIDADDTQMRQLLQNVVGNALKYCQPGQAPEVEVLAEYFDRGGEPWSRIRVRDHGIGFEPQYAEKIFGVFDRLHTREQYEGTGIGLAVCRRIVERHGGSIRAEGAPGEGALFSIELPVHHAPREI